MANWVVSIDIKQFLHSDDETPNGVLETAKNIRDEIYREHYAKRFLGDWADILVEETQHAVECGENYETCCEIFNGALETIYDDADDCLIWLGL